jgi:hypothetical protein
VPPVEIEKLSSQGAKQDTERGNQGSRSDGTAKCHCFSRSIDS